MAAAGTTKAAANHDPLEFARALLAANPNAVAMAITRDGVDLPVPGDLGLPSRQCPEPRGLGIFGDDVTTVIVAFEQALRDGSARCRVRVSGTEDDCFANLHMMDARPAFDGLVSVLVPEGDSESVAEMHAKAPVGRIAQMTRDQVGVILTVDPALERLLKRSNAELVGRRSHQFIHPDDLDLAVANWAELIKSPGLSRRLRLRFRTGEGSYVWLEVTSNNQLAAGGAVVSDLVDITAEMLEQEKVAEREKLLHSLTNALPLGVMRVDAMGGITYANSQLPVELGFEVPEDIEGLTASIAPADRTTFRRAVEEGLRGTDGDAQVLIEHPGLRGRVCNVSVRGLSGKVSAGVLVCVTEVTEAVRLRAQLENQASHDSLTGCLNRAAILHGISAALAQSDHGGLAAVFVDVNRFKSINDRLGHAAGDELLVIVGQRLRNMLRPGDAAGRLGGDEFLLMFRGVASSTQAQHIGDRVARLLDAHVQLGTESVPVSASVGVSWTARKLTTADHLIALADAAMYTAKRSGESAAVLAP